MLKLVALEPNINNENMGENLHVSVLEVIWIFDKFQRMQKKQQSLCKWKFSKQYPRVL